MPFILMAFFATPQSGAPATPPTVARPTPQTPTSDIDEAELEKVCRRVEERHRERLTAAAQAAARVREVARFVLLRLPWSSLAHASVVCRAWRDIVRDHNFRPKAKELARVLTEVSTRDADEREQYGGFQSAAAAMQQVQPRRPWLKEICASLATRRSRLRAGWLGRLDAPSDVARAVMTATSIAGELGLCADSSPWSVGAAVLLCCDGGGSIARAAFVLWRAIDRGCPVEAHADVTELLAHICVELLPRRAARRALADEMLDALDAFESHPLPQSSATRREWTLEQQAFIAADLQPNDLLLCAAYAGTGKTTTVAEYVRRRSRDQRFLILYFNTSMAAEMQTRMSGIAGVEVKTFDAEVLRHVRRSLPPQKIKLDEDGIGPPTEVVQRICAHTGNHRYRKTILRHTIQTLRYWLHNMHVNLDIVPNKVQKWWEPRMKKSRDENWEEQLTLPDFCELARSVWRSMMCMRTQDACLSYAALSKALMLRTMLDRDPTKEAKLRWSFPDTGRSVIHCLEPLDLQQAYHTIIIDEAQDINPPHRFLFVDAQRSTGSACRHILVGDAHQSLYSFRGAKNALREMEGVASCSLKLTHSFRFGRPLARLASLVLQKCVRREDEPLPPNLVGRGPPTRLVFSQEAQENLLVLAQRNKTTLVVAGRFAAAGARVSVVGPEKYVSELIGKVRDLLRLLQNDTATMPHEGEQLTWEQLLAYKEEDALDDQNLIVCIDLVEERGEDALRILNDIKTSAECDASAAEVKVSTTHKYKGLEAENLLLANDFAPASASDNIIGGPNLDMSFDQRCRLYTAMTRARSSCCLAEKPDLARLWGMFCCYPILRPIGVSEEERNRAAAATVCGCCFSTRHPSVRGAWRIVSSSGEDRGMCGACEATLLRGNDMLGAWGLSSGDAGGP